MNVQGEKPVEKDSLESSSDLSLQHTSESEEPSTKRGLCYTLGVRDWKTYMKKNKNKKSKKTKSNKVKKTPKPKNDKVATKPTVFFATKSTHPSFMMRMVEDSGIIPRANRLAETQKTFSKLPQQAEAFLAYGDSAEAAKQIAMAVMNSEESEETLNEYKKRLSSNLFAGVLKEMDSIRKSHFDGLTANTNECEKIRGRIAEGAKRVATDSEYGCHSFFVHEVLADNGIDLPYCLNLDVICDFLEEEVQVLEQLLPEGSFEEGPGVTVSDHTGQIWLNLFEQTLPHTYFELVRGNLLEIRKGLDDYIVSVARERREPGYDGHNPEAGYSRNEEESDDEPKDPASIQRRIMEKVFDTLPPKYFAFCLQNLPSFKGMLEEYISAELSAPKKGMNTNIQVTKPAARNSEKSKKMKKKIERPESIPANNWHRFYDLGNQFADFILDVFELFESGDFDSWDKDRTKKMDSALRGGNVDVLEYILYERMKEKEFFCCQLCQETLFNWKQALIHYACNLHRRNEKASANAIIFEGFRRILSSITDIPEQMGNKYFMRHLSRYTQNRNVRINDGIPSGDFVKSMYDKYWSLVALDKKELTAEQLSALESNQLVFGAETLIARVKSDLGRAAMAELHEHLGKGKTRCEYCACDTGNREEFYDHMLNTIHVHNSNDTCRKMKGEPFTPYCILTLLVNVHRKEIINDPSEPGYNGVRAVDTEDDKKRKKEMEEASKYLTPFCAKMKKDNEKTTIAKPESISDDIWRNFNKLGNDVADFVLDVFHLYGTKDFESWDKNRVKNIESALNQVNEEAREGRNLVCEFILIEKMKEKELFWCALCGEIFFNYKQAFIHFMSKAHRDSDNSAHASIAGFQGVVISFTKHPKTWIEKDEITEKGRTIMNGAFCTKHVIQSGGCPSQTFVESWEKKYSGLSKGIVMSSNMGPNMLDTIASRMKTDMGRNAFAELHDHLSQRSTYCVYCRVNTGDCEGFYAHNLSYTHAKNYNEQMNNMIKKKKLESPYVCLITALINVHKKDLI